MPPIKLDSSRMLTTAAVENRNLAPRQLGVDMKTRWIGLATTLLSLGCMNLSAVAGSDRTGKEVAETVCISCHATGKDGAPIMGDQAAWRHRASKGLEKLTKNALTGLRTMPAHGGQAALTDLEMTRAVAYMVSDGTAVDVDKVYAWPQVRSGAQVVQERCQECHSTGANGAPKIGEMIDWRPRLKAGVDALVRSAITGHNAMPARGGLANMSDAEIRGAVEFMVGKAGGKVAAK
jgi:cytochrome c5